MKRCIGYNNITVRINRKIKIGFSFLPHYNCFLHASFCYGLQSASNWQNDRRTESAIADKWSGNTRSRKVCTNVWYS